MAERIVNVPINFIVNSVQLQKGEADVKRVQAATDALRSSTQKYSDQAAKGFSATSGSIASMNAQLQRLRTQIEVTSSSDTKRLNALSAQYRTLQAQIQAQTRAYLEQGRVIKDNATNFQELYNAARLFVTAGVVKEVFSLSLNMAILSGNVEGVTKAFNRLPNATLLLEDLRRATHGTVTDLELMQRALMAQNYKIPLTSLGKLLEFAAVKAQQTGQEVNHLVDYIVTGIGLRSLKRLDDLGFSANRVREALGGVSIQAASMGQIMTAVTTLMQEDLDKTGGFAETSKTKVEQLQRSWHDLKVTISQTLTSPALLNFYQKFLDNFKAGVDFLTGKSAEDGAAKQEAVKSVQLFKQMHLSEEILKNKQKALDIIQQEINTQQSLIGRNNDELTKIKESYDAIANSGRRVTYEEHAQVKELQKQSEFYVFKNAQLKESQRILKEYMRSLEQVTEEERPDASGDADNKRGDLMKPLTAVVDIRFKDPKTGDIIKGQNDKVIQDLAASGTDIVKTAVDRINANLMAIKEGTVFIPMEPYTPSDFIDKLNEQLDLRKSEIATTGINILADQLITAEEAEIASLEKRLRAHEDYYDEQQKLAGNNERARMEIAIKGEREAQKIREEIAMREWRARRTSVLIDTAAGIMRAFATMPTPAAIIESGIIAALGLSQLAIVNRNRPGFAEGVIDLKGPGTSKSDSIPANLSRGESVMTAEETDSSRGIFKAIRAKRLNDRVMKEILTGRSGGSVGTVFDDSRLLKKMDELKDAQPDLVGRANLVYEKRKKGDDYWQYIRSKSMGK